MQKNAPSSVPSPAERQADRAWRLLHRDAGPALRLLERAIPVAKAARDERGLAWLQLVMGFHELYFGDLARAEAMLSESREQHGRLGDARGQILAATGVGRAWWRQGQAERALQLLQPLRDESLALLRRPERSVLLNALGGCHSTLGNSEQALACLYQALRDASPLQGHGFDVTLHCNLSHELLELGDFEEALRQVDRGLARLAGQANQRLERVLLINRALCLTELGRAGEALDSVRRILGLAPSEGPSAGPALNVELLAVTPLRAGDRPLADALIARADPKLPDDHVALQLALSLRALQDGLMAEAKAHLDKATPLLEGRGDARVSLRLRSAHALARADYHEAAGEPSLALAAWREWQKLHATRSERAGAARHLASILQTELLQLRHRLEENEARRQAAERAKEALARANDQLTLKIAEVQSLQAQLQAQATQDALTGLANRRHLNDSLPTMLALAQREATPLAVVLIDLDHFKRVNDTYGHPAGDQLLAAFGALLREHLRKSDRAFRYGGEEFCLLLPNTPTEDARHKIEGLQKRWKASTFSLADGTQLGNQSFSAGVTDSLATPESGTVLLHIADERLLCAKRQQRGSVVSAAPSS